MRYLQLSSLVLLLFYCSSFKVKPSLPEMGFQDEKYRAVVDVSSKHLSGILVVKRIDIHEYRVVFMNEMGVTFFDYSFLENSYKVNQIMSKLNKKAVKQTLAKDFGMLLGESIFKKETTQRQDSVITVDLQKKGSVEYILQHKKVKRIENLGKKKSVVTILPFYQEASLSPDSVSIQHHTFNFTIQLKKFQDAE